MTTEPQRTSAGRLYIQRMVRKTIFTVQRMEIYPADSGIICPLNNRPGFWSRSGSEKTYTATAYVQASAAKRTQCFPISSSQFTEYHKYPEGMSPLNVYKLKNLHVCLTGLANKI